MHVLEPPDLWQRYIDPAWKHAALVGLTELRRDMRVKVKSSVVLRIGTVRPQRGDAAGPWSTAQDEAFAEAERRGWDAVSQLQAMDREGLDVAVLFPSRGLFVLGLDVPQVTGIDGLEPDFAAAIARAYNDWLRDFCAHAPERMLGAGMVAPHDVAAAVAEARRCVEQLGFKAIFLAPGCVARRPWHDPYYDPLWAECERLGIPVTFHGGGQTYLKPDFSLEVLDKHWEWVGRYEVPEVRKKPSEYFRSNCFLAVEADETPVKQYVEWFGDENLVFSTDYPHAYSKYPHSVEAFMKLPLSEASQRKIL